MSEVTYKKLRDGNWGLQGPNLAEGKAVVVKKRDGSTETQRVGKVIFSDKSTGYSIATIDGQTAQRSSSPRRSGPPRSGGDQVKRCWECGCTFTYADARRNGGDWQDSYCGC